jgi:hypothetical protein
MKRTMKFQSGLVIILAVGLLMSLGAHAQDSLPPLMRQNNNGNWPSDADAQKLLDELYYQRAIHAYINTLPVLNTIGMRDGSEKTFGKG